MYNEPFALHKNYITFIQNGIMEQKELLKKAQNTRPYVWDVGGAEREELTDGSERMHQFFHLPTCIVKQHGPWKT